MTRSTLLRLLLSALSIKPIVMWADIILVIILCAAHITSGFIERLRRRIAVAKACAEVDPVSFSNKTQLKRGPTCLFPFISFGPRFNGVLLVEREGHGCHLTGHQDPKSNAYRQGPNSKRKCDTPVD